MLEERRGGPAKNESLTMMGPAKLTEKVSFKDGACAASLNSAVHEVKAEFILLLNERVVSRKDSLDALVSVYSPAYILS
jgi:hypothetical protein